ncbi:hypothetical protein, partial [Alloalcanivorax venustensis]|uniref:hypothetical protein n=1 Tax=Alloalcanivorax venustensis TaxID=172371 RepID=UPI003C3386D7
VKGAKACADLDEFSTVSVPVKKSDKKPAAKKKAARKRPAPSPAPDTQGGFAKPKRRKNPGPLD